jgi:bifunctional ADP-heptose synthase (sugar kinase/adenylyltransferase)
LSNVLLLGDLILDQYRHLTPTRICPEAPVPVYVQTQDTYETRGGVGLVQAQLEEFLGAGSVTTICGSKSRKERLIADGRLIGRIDFDSIETNPAILERSALDELTEQDFDMAIISDYGKGAINPSSAKRILAYAKKHEVPVLVDSKHIGLWYDGAFAFFPNASEETITCSGHSIRKLGAQGCKVDGVLTEPTIVQEVDPTGAGDIFLAAFASKLLRSNQAIWDDKDVLHCCAAFANEVAAISVTHPGTYVVKKTEVLGL